MCISRWPIPKQVELKGGLHHYQSFTLEFFCGAISGAGSGMHVLVCYVWNMELWCLSRKWFVCLWSYFVDKCRVYILYVLTCLNVLLIYVMGSSSVVSNFCIHGMCEVAIAHDAETMIRASFHPLVAMMLMNGWQFVVFLLRASMVNLSLQYVKSISCMVSYGVQFSSR